MQLPRQHSSIPLQGIGAIKAGRTRGSVAIQLQSRFESPQKCLIITHVLPRITSNILDIKSINTHWPHIEGLTLADPESSSSSNIDVIIGADYYGQILQEGLRKGPIGSPTAQSTIFGWVLFGPSASSPNEARIYHVSVDEELNELLQQFWRLDELPASFKSTLSVSEQECNDHFKSTFSRDESGRYTVRLPFKQSTDLLGDSKSTALRMLQRLSKRLQSDTSLEKAYSEFLKEYETLNHMKPAPIADPEPRSTNYLPHHGVTRANSVTTKLRVVFNASSRTSSGLSLNDILQTGAKLQTELFDVLIHFRRFIYVFLSDVEKMYRRIKVHQDDWNFQRILWKNEAGETVTYILTTVTYGLACAPFLALRLIIQLIEDEGINFPLAIETLTKGRYVDDVFGGADTIDQAQETVAHVNNMCMAGGFPLQKWISNDPTILKSIPAHRQLFQTSVPIDQNAIVHTLGMNWNPTTDTFHFTWTNPPMQKQTKRGILSTIARLFDPLGLISPIVITAQVFIQELWSLKLDWDDILPSQFFKRWMRFMEQLQDLPLLSFPRWL